MKSYFIRLFQYDKFANSRLIELLLTTGITGKPLNLIAHLLAAEKIWLNRCKAITESNIELWPTLQANSLREINNSNHEEWISYLNALNDGDFNNIIHYKNSAGSSFQNTLCDVLGHVINHGTHTRAQAGQHLKLSENDKLPVTDYSYYLRQIHS